MEEFLGMMISLLIGGANPMDIVKMMTRAKGAVGNDPIASIRSEQIKQAIRAYPVGATQETIDSNVLSMLAGMGYNPHGVWAEGASKIIGQAYHMFPDVLGPVLGLPSPETFFSTVANGANAITTASGGVPGGIFNAFSTMSSHRRAMDLANRVYGMASRRDANGNFAGYNAEYAHGLSMGEMGLVTQRMLASDLMYSSRADANDGKLDVESEAFSKKLKDFGSKLNEVTSSITKITGSMVETLALMDRMGGGNFLSGTENDALKVMSRARNMAAAVRMASAASGMSAQETYGYMNGLAGAMMGGYGLDATMASLSQSRGAADWMSGLGMIAFGSWAEAHPGAPLLERARARMGIEGRFSNYSNSDAEKDVAIMAANTELFTERDREYARRSLAMGDSQSVRRLVAEKIGRERHAAMINDPAILQAMRETANTEWYTELSAATVTGELSQAAVFGSNVDLRRIFRDMDSEMVGVGGYRGMTARDAASKKALVGLASERGIVGADVAANMSIEDLENAMKRGGVAKTTIDMARNRAQAQVALEDVEAATMTTKEEAGVMANVKRDIEQNTSGKVKERLLAIVNGGAGAADVIREYLLSQGVVDEDRVNKALRRYTNGKLTRAEADAARTKLDEHLRLNAEGTQEEDDRIREAKATRIASEKTTKLMALIRQEGVESDSDALNAFDDAVKGMTDADASELNVDAAREMLMSRIGDRLGDLSGEDLGAAIEDAAVEMSRRIGGGSSVEEGLNAGLLSVFTKMNAGDKEGVAQWQKLMDDAKGKGRALREEFLSNKKTAVDKLVSEDVLREGVEISDEERLAARTSAKGGKMAAMAANGANQATLNFLASQYNIPVETLANNEELANVLGRLGVSTANANENRIKNAIGGQGGVNNHLQYISDKLAEINSWMKETGNTWAKLDRLAGGAGERKPLEDALKSLEGEKGEESAYLVKQVLDDKDLAGIRKIIVGGGELTREQQDLIAKKMGESSKGGLAEEILKLIQEIVAHIVKLSRQGIDVTNLKLAS